MNWWNVTNAVLFKLSWLACVVGGAANQLLWGVLILMLMLGQALIGTAWRRDLCLGAVLGIFGFLLDTLWIRVGVLDYGTALAPLWIVILWIIVGLSLHHCLSFFHRRPWLGGIVAGVGAPFSYLAGESLGAVTIDDPARLVAVAVVWVLAFAALFTLASRQGGGRDGKAVARPDHLHGRSSYERAH